MRSLQGWDVMLQKAKSLVLLQDSTCKEHEGGGNLHSLHGVSSIRDK